MVGVDILTGKSGHYKRIKKDTTSLHRAQTLDSGETPLVEGQADKIFEGARAAHLTKQNENAMNMDDILAALSTKAEDEPAEGAESDSALDPEALSEEDDLAADAATEKAASRGCWSRQQSEAVATSKAAAKSKAATRSSPSKAAAPAVPANQSPGKAQAAAQAARAAAGTARKRKGQEFNEEVVQKQLETWRLASDRLKDFGGYMDVSSVKQTSAFQQLEKRRQREAQTHFSSTQAKLKDKQFRLCAPEGLINEVTSLRDLFGVIFRVARAMAQASLTAPFELQANISTLMELGVSIPAQHITSMLKFTVVELIKFGKFSELASLLGGNEWTQALLDGGMDTEGINMFYFGQIADCATKIMKAVTLAEIDAGVYSGENGLARLHTMLSSVSSVVNDEMKSKIRLAIALVRPAEGSIETLGTALDKVAEDQPPPLLAPYTGCPPGKAIINKACMVYESRDDERKFAETKSKVDLLLTQTNDDNDNVDERSALDTLMEFRQRIADLSEDGKTLSAAIQANCGEVAGS